MLQKVIETAFAERTMLTIAVSIVQCEFLNAFRLNCKIFFFFIPKLIAENCPRNCISNSIASQPYSTRTAFWCLMREGWPSMERLMSFFKWKTESSHLSSMATKCEQCQLSSPLGAVKIFEITLT